jgi:Fe-S cluster assembly protein SufD
MVMDGSSMLELQQLQKNALENFTAQGFPTTQHEDWKYTNVAPIVQQNFKPASQLNEKISLQDLQPFINPDLDCFRLVFIDGHFSKKLSADLPKNITSLIKALKENPMVVQSYLNKFNNSKTIGFNDFNTAFFQDGAYIHLTDEAIKPIELLFIATAQQEKQLVPVRNLIVAAANSQATIIEHYVSLNSKNYFTNVVTELMLDEYAKIEHCKLIQENNTAFHIGTLQVTQQAYSQFTSHSFAWSGKLVRSDTNVCLAAEHAECTLNGLYIANGHQHIDHHTLVDHAKPHGTSRECYKGIIGDQARAVFNGKVYVHPDAQKTNAQQSNKNLLLSDQAEIDTKPQLEIYADDVQCAHGTTVGQLDEDALFYLRSRAIPETAARNMLMYAFARDIIERVSLEPLREYLEKKLQEIM